VDLPFEVVISSEALSSGGGGGAVDLVNISAYSKAFMVFNFSFSR